MPLGYSLRVIDNRLVVDATSGHSMVMLADAQRMNVDIGGHGVYFFIMTNGNHEHVVQIEIMEMFWRLYGVAEVEIELMRRGLMPQGLGRDVTQLYGAGTEVVQAGVGYKGLESADGENLEGWELETEHPESQMGSGRPTSWSSR